MVNAHAIVFACAWLPACAEDLLLINNQKTRLFYASLPEGLTPVRATPSNTPGPARRHSLTAPLTYGTYGVLAAAPSPPAAPVALLRHCSLGGLL